MMTRMCIFIKGQVFRGGQSAAGVRMRSMMGSLDRLRNMATRLQHAAFLKGTAEVVGHVVVHAHGGKNNGEIGARSSSGDFRLPDDLGGQLVVPHAGAGENRQLLAADQGHHAVDGGDAGAM